MRLYTWWRSQSAYRVRIALALKGLHAEMIQVDVLKGEQHSSEYRALNPEGVLPTLIDGDGPPLVQSLAILEYLDEQYPDPPLLPTDPYERAYVRGLAYVVVADAHPFITPRVRKVLTQKFGVDDSAHMGWIRYWLDSASEVIEQQLARSRSRGDFCCGNKPTMGDICLVAHLSSAKMLYECDLDRFPIVQQILENCMQLEAFNSTHPARQPGAPGAL